MNKIAGGSAGYRLPELHLPEAVASEAADRLFNDFEIPFGRTQQRIIVAGPSVSVLFLSFSRPVPLVVLSGELVAQYVTVSGRRHQEMVAELLDAHWAQKSAGRRFVAAHSLLSEGRGETRLGFLDLVLNATEDALFHETPPLLPPPEFHEAGLPSLLGQLNQIEDSKFLLDTLNKVTLRQIDIPRGMLPDHPALELLSRLLCIDRNMGIGAIRKLLRPDSDLPFRSGYFQLSLTGLLLAKLAMESRVGIDRGWMWDEIQYLREEGIEAFEDFSLGLALLAAFLAIAIVMEEATPTAMDLLDREIDRSLELSKVPQERESFLRFLGDSLSQAITSENLHMHLPKLMVFFKYGKDEPSLVRQNNRLLRLLRETFKPAKEFFAR